MKSLSPIEVPDAAYDATGWNGSTQVPSKNAVRDKLEAAIVASGTSFPGSPTSGDRFYRTDLHETAYYDGTRWLAEQIEQFDLNTKYDTFTATTTVVGRWRNPNSQDIFVIDVSWSVSVSGTGNWTVIVETNAPATVASTVVTAATFTTDAVNSAVLGASFFNLNVVENSGTASIRPTATVRYRRILT